MITTLLVLIILAVLWPVTMLRVFSFLFQAAAVIFICTAVFLLTLYAG